jgi:hypothetical protein
MHARSSARKPALNQTPVITATGKAFFDVGQYARLRARVEPCERPCCSIHKPSAAVAEPNCGEHVGDFKKP